jgi:hypothetical protein
MIVIAVGVLILILGLIWIYASSGSSKDPMTQFGSDLVSIREVLNNEAHLHRLLMIEVICKETKESKEPKKSDEASETITFNKMASGAITLGKSLVRSFGATIAQRISTLMQKRNEILRDYYGALCRMICENGECTLDLQKDTKRPVFPPIFLSEEALKSVPSSVLDITTLTERNLAGISREITDQVAGSFQIRDIDQGAAKNRPLLHFQRLFNLMMMYDKELVNQAKSYALHHYDISMNCAQSSVELTKHLSDELGILMRESREHGVATRTP